MKWQILFHFLIIFWTPGTPLSTFDSLYDLEANWYNHFPRHGRHLLYWFINNSVVDSTTDTIKPLFDPTRGDYGFGYFANGDSLLPTSTGNQAYYIVGDMRETNTRALPEYVTQNYQNSQDSGDRNRDRLVVRVTTGSDQVTAVDGVYVTQLYPLNNKRDSVYDSIHTYNVGFKLVREIQRLQRNDSLGLDAFLSQSGYKSCLPLEHQACSPKAVSFQQLKMVEIQDGDNCQPLQLHVKSTCNGRARIHWSNIPFTVLDSSVIVALYKDGDSEVKLAEVPVESTATSGTFDSGEATWYATSGTFDSGEALNSGLQVRLLKYSVDSEHAGEMKEREVWRGPEFHDANGAPPVAITGYPASVQLYARGGNACVRLYVTRSFTDWKDTFSLSWVGFYSNNSVDNDHYQAYQWVVRLYKESPSEKTPDYDVYEYESSQTVGTGVNARFFQSREYQETVRTPAWE